MSLAARCQQAAWLTRTCARLEDPAEAVGAEVHIPARAQGVPPGGYVASKPAARQLAEMSRATQLPAEPCSKLSRGFPVLPVTCMHRHTLMRHGACRCARYSRQTRGCALDRSRMPSLPRPREAGMVPVRRFWLSLTMTPSSGAAVQCQRSSSSGPAVHGCRVPAWWCWA